MESNPLISAPASGPVIVATWIAATVLLALRLDTGLLAHAASGFA